MPPSSLPHPIADLLKQGFAGPAWHGPHLRGSLRGLRRDALLFRPAPDAHNIWELAVHCAYWKYAVRNRLSGGRRGSFALEGSNFFRRDASNTPADWKRDLALLDAEHRKLARLLAKLGPADLARRAPSSKHTVQATALGVAAHDVYHAGQIRLLKKLAAGRVRRRTPATDS